MNHTGGFPDLKMFCNVTPLKIWWKKTIEIFWGYSVVFYNHNIIASFFCTVILLLKDDDDDDNHKKKKKIKIISNSKI